MSSGSDSQHYIDLRSSVDLGRSNFALLDVGVKDDVDDTNNSNNNNNKDKDKDKGIDPAHDANHPTDAATVSSPRKGIKTKTKTKLKRKSKKKSKGLQPISPRSRSDLAAEEDISAFSLSGHGHGVGVAAAASAASGQSGAFDVVLYDRGLFIDSGSGQAEMDDGTDGMQSLDAYQSSCCGSLWSCGGRCGLAARLWAFLKRLSLTQRTLIGVVLGVLAGVLIQPHEPNDSVVEILGYPGELFLRALKMCVLPLIAVNMLLATQRMGDLAKAKKLAKRALAYYLTTTFCAACIGN